MGFGEKDLQDVKLARPVALVDLWAIDDRIDRLEVITERLEAITRNLVNLYHQERVKNWELILNQMMKEMDRKNGKFKTS
jgi:hypothetical protein